MGTTFKVKKDFIAPTLKMLYEIPYPNFIPPHTKQKKNGNWQTPTHPQIHYKFYYSPHIIDRLYRMIHKYINNINSLIVSHL